MDPDGAWDTRVGDEADAYGQGGGYYEEQELGLHPPAAEAGGSYAGGGYGGSRSQALPEYGAEQVERGRSRSRDEEAFIGGGQRGLDERYDEEMGRKDPFGDGAERSVLRGVDGPGPVELEGGSGGLRVQKEKGRHDDSPTERRSMFRENM